MDTHEKISADLFDDIDKEEMRKALVVFREGKNLVKETEHFLEEKIKKLNLSTGEEIALKIYVSSVVNQANEVAAAFAAEKKSKEECFAQFDKLRYHMRKEFSETAEKVSK